MQSSLCQLAFRQGKSKKKSVKDNIKEYVYDLRIGKDFFNRTSKILIIKNDKLYCIKIKNFYSLKDTIKS